MVKILQPRAYESWAKRAFFRPRKFFRGIELGKPYMFLYPEDERMGSLSQAPIILPLRFFTKGRMMGLNLTTLPSRIIRKRVYAEYTAIGALASNNAKKEALRRLERKYRGSELYKNSIGFYVPNKIKSKIIELEMPEIEDVVGRIL